MSRLLHGDEPELDADTAFDVGVWDLGLSPVEQLDAPHKGPAIALLPDARALPEVLAQGFSGALLRTRDATEISAAASAVAAGMVVIDEAFISALGMREPRPRSSVELTAREKQVVALIAEGLSNKRIADRLGISEHTAKFHVNAIIQKLGAETRTDAVVRAARLGFLTI
ncbi:MAG: response regulator transcription factor [Myxococcota bacterium]